MRNMSRHGLARRLLFPYSGEEALTLKQSLRVLLAWMVVIPLAMACITLAFAALLAVSFTAIVTSVLFTFLSGAFIFGSLGVLIVVTNNWSARIRHTRQTAGASNTSGVKDGSKR